MPIRVTILILQTLKHFNEVLDDIQRATTNMHAGAYYKDIDKKLGAEIKKREKKLARGCSE